MANDYKYAMEIDRAREKALRYLKAEMKFYQDAKEDGRIYVSINNVIGGMECMLDILQVESKKQDGWIPTKLIPNEGADSCDNEYVIEADREHALVFVSVRGNVKLDKVIEEDGGYSFEKYMPESVQAWMPIEIPEPYRKE